jgi:hypothetical protein
MASHGFDVRFFDFELMRSMASYGRLAGNAMSLPAIGAVQAAILAFIDLGAGRSHLRAPGSGLIGRMPLELMFCAQSGDTCMSSSESSSSSSSSCSSSDNMSSDESSAV